MSDMSPYLEDKVNDHVNGVSAYTMPAVVGVALFNGDPLGAGVEVTTDVRAAGRVALSMAASSGGVAASDADADFGNADGPATVTHTCTFDALSGGNKLMADALSSTQEISAGNPVNYPAGDITTTYD